MSDNDISLELQQQVENAYTDAKPLRIRGGNSKAFYGNPTTGDELLVAPHCGIISYEPTELVITARAGTPLSKIQQTLAEQGQFLPFDPPAYGEQATIGGAIAGNFSGPGRVHFGAARDYMLGCKIINGKGEILHFGGEVMKNVAGYDVSRLMCGALGTLGVLLEVSLKVLPRPEQQRTFIYDFSTKQSIEKLHQWAQKSIPITGSCFDHQHLLLRMCGTESYLKQMRDFLGGSEFSEASDFWTDVREHQSPFFIRNNDKNLWRLSVPSNTPLLDLEGESLYEWHGGLRWFASDESMDKIRERVQTQGGHATLFKLGEERHGNGTSGDSNPMTGNHFHPLTPVIKKMHLNLKLAFDPKNILNRGKLCPDI